MKFVYTTHINDRIKERGTDNNEVETAMRTGTRLPDLPGRIKFVKNFACNTNRQDVVFNHKKVEVSAECVDPKTDTWKLITVIVKFYNI